VLVETTQLWPLSFGLTVMKRKGPTSRDLGGEGRFWSKRKRAPTVVCVKAVRWHFPESVCFRWFTFQCCALAGHDKSPHWPFFGCNSSVTITAESCACCFHSTEQPVAVHSLPGKRLRFPHKKTIDKRDVMREWCSFFDFLCGEENSGQLVRLSTTRVVIIDQQPPAD
jgi:hypothetical protein